MSPASGQGLRRRLFIIWTLWMWLAWLLSGEVEKTFKTPAALLSILTPPWPHFGLAILNALRALITTSLIMLALSGAGRKALILFRPNLGQESAGLDNFIFARIFTRKRLFEIAAGIPVVAFLAQGLGLLGLADRISLAVTVLACSGLALSRRKTLQSERNISSPTGPSFLILISWAGMILAGLAALAPEVAWDSMVYHLRVPELYLLDHRIHPIPEIFPSYFPFNGQMLLMLAKNLGGDPGAKLLHSALWLACGVGTARLAASLWGKTSAEWGLALALTLPLGMVIGSRGYVEFFLVLPVICAAILFFPKRRLGSSTLFLVGWLAGAAAGTKHQGALAGLALAIAALFRAGASGRGALLLLAGGTLSSGAWFLRDLLWTGNPVYPVFFGGPHWTAMDTAGWKSDASALQFDLRKLITAPWFLMKSPPSDGGISPMLLSAAAVPLLWRSARGGIWLLALSMLALWWASSPLTRYLAPALFLACAAAAGTLSGRDLGESGEKWCLRLARLGLLISLACGFESIFFSTEPYGAATGKWTTAEYRQRRLAPPGAFEMFAKLEEVVPAGKRVYLMGHAFAYGLPRRAWTEFLYVRNPLYWWLDGADSSREILVRARQAGLTHIAWHEMGDRVFNGRVPGYMDWNNAKISSWSDFWSSNVTEVYTAGFWHIYEIAPRTHRYPLPSFTLPGTEAIVGPIDFALDRGDFAEAGVLARAARITYPALSSYLDDRIKRARLKQQSYLPIKRDN